MTEQFSNAGISTLNGTITSGATSLTVVSAASFPTTGNFRIRVEQEIMLVTAVSTNTFTVTRAQESTTAAAHNSGVQVVHIVTAGGLAQMHKDIVQVGAYANRPTAGGGNAMYIPTDGTCFFADDGTQWRPMLDGILGYEVAPGNSLAAFTNYNTTPTSGPTMTGGCVWFFHTSNGATQNLCGYEVTKTSGQTLTCCFIPWCTPNAVGGIAVAGIFARDSAGGHFQGFGMTENEAADTSDSLGYVTIDNYTNGTTFSTNQVKRYANFMRRDKVWFRITDDGTNLNYQWSNDGVNWNTQFSDSTWVPSRGNRYGFYISPYNQDSGITVLSFRVA